MNPSDPLTTMNITVDHTLGGHKYTINADLNDSADVLKQKIQAVSGILARQQMLLFKGKKLFRDQTLLDLKYELDYPIHLFHKATKSKKIKIKASAEQLYELEVYDHETIDDLKHLIAEIVEIKTSEQILVYEGKILEDKKFIYDFNFVDEEAVIELLQKEG